MPDKSPSLAATPVSKRAFLGMTGIGAAAMILPTASAAAKAPANMMAGSLDLSRVDIIDTHAHPVGRMLITQSYARQAEEFAALAVPPGDFPGRAEAVARATAGGKALVWNAPRRTGYFNYIARTYGVPATFEGFDSVTSRHIGSDADFSRYVEMIFDRERISAVVLQAREAAPAAPATLIPANRYVWTSVASDMTRLAWAKEQGLTTLGDVTAAIETTMEKAVENGCRGFKNGSAYYRTLGLTWPTAREAEAAFRRLRATPPSSVGVRDQPVYDDPALAAAQTIYEDYLFKRIYMKAGQLQRPAIIHSAVALHPSLRTDFNDPRPLYDVFTHPDILKAQTDFVLIHTGYPAHDVVAAFVSQLSNVYVDVSFFSKYPGTLLQTYRSLLGLGSSERIMHGSDANSVPEEIGYCAWNSRAALATVLSEYKKSFGWKQADIDTIAQNVMHRNARRLFRIPA